MFDNKQTEVVTVTGKYGKFYFPVLYTHICLGKGLNPYHTAKFLCHSTLNALGINRSLAVLVINEKARIRPQGFLWCWELRQPYTFNGTGSSPPPALLLTWSLASSGGSENSENPAD